MSCPLGSFYESVVLLPYVGAIPNSVLCVIVKWLYKLCINFGMQAC